MPESVTQAELVLRVPWNLPLLQDILVCLEDLVARTGDSSFLAEVEERCTSSNVATFVADVDRLFQQSLPVGCAASYLAFCAEVGLGDLTRPALPILHRESNFSVALDWLIGLQRLLDLSTARANDTKRHKPTNAETVSVDSSHSLQQERSLLDMVNDMAFTNPRDMRQWLQAQTIESLQRLTIVFAVAEPGEDTRSDELLVVLRCLRHVLQLLFERIGFNYRLNREKHASVKRLAYGASHEINNPLANIATRAQTLLRDEIDPQRRQVLQMINAQAFRAFDMLANLMHYASPPPLKRQTADLGELIKMSIESAKGHFPSFAWQNLTLKLPEASLPWSVDTRQFCTLIHSLLRNAIEANATDNRVSISLTHVALGTPKQAGVLLQFEDLGQAVDDKDLSCFCDPFYSGREAGRGLGFGLAKARAIVDSHGGELTLQACQPSGLRVSVWLPIADGAEGVVE